MVLDVPVLEMLSRSPSKEDISAAAADVDCPNGSGFDRITTPDPPLEDAAGPVAVVPAPVEDPQWTSMCSAANVNDSASLEEPPPLPRVVGGADSTTGVVAAVGVDALFDVFPLAGEIRRMTVPTECRAEFASDVFLDADGWLADVGVGVDWDESADWIPPEQDVELADCCTLTGWW